MYEMRLSDETVATVSAVLHAFEELCKQKDDLEMTLMVTRANREFHEQIRTCDREREAGTAADGPLVGPGSKSTN